MRSTDVVHNTILKEKLAAVFHIKEGVSTFQPPRSRLKEEMDPLAMTSATKTRSTKTAHKTKATKTADPEPAPAAPEPKAKIKPASTRSGGPRYVTPPKRRNPFSVHAFSATPVAASAELLPEPVIDSSPEAEEPSLPFVVENDKTPTVVADATPQSAFPGETAMATALTLPDETVLFFDEKPPVSKTTSPDMEAAIHLALQAARPVPSAQPEPAVTAVETGPAADPLPADLNWLSKPTPFGDPLQGMVAKLRNAKTKIACSLEQLRGRQKKVEEELFAVQYEVEQARDNLRKIDDTISACALVAEQSASIQAGVLSEGNHHKKSADGSSRRGVPMPDKDDPSILRVEDLRQFFKDNPGTNWSAAEIREQMPLIKREHAKVYLPSALTVMAAANEIERVDRGIYRAVIATS